MAITRLSELTTGQSAMIVKILGHGAFRKRVMEMGFVRGRDVKVILHAPLKDPIKYGILGYEVSLRKAEAHLIVVETSDESAVTPLTKNEVTEPEIRPDIVQPVSYNLPPHRHINVALIGNPNCGKTSLFNHLTGRQEHVGNYSGVTVGASSSSMQYRGYTFNIVDLPGTYSVSAYSPEEIYVRNYLREETPDVIINVVDASNIERNMYLTTEIIDMDRSMVICLNMYDELLNAGHKLDYELLGKMIGVPMVPTVSKTGKGIDKLLDTVISVYEDKNQAVRHIHISLGSDIEKAVTVLKDLIKQHGDVGHVLSPRYLAIKLLEGDPEVERIINSAKGGYSILARRDELLKHLHELTDEDVAETIAAEKYGFIAGAMAETMQRSKVEKVTTTAVIDRIVTNRYIGYPLFFALMFLTFWLTFMLGQYPMDWIQSGVDWLSAIVAAYLPDGILKDLIADGVIGGVGGVIVFLPNILILYFCISFMEDTGYMARAAFIMDKLMHRIGLHGKSFIPLVMGFGCNVPAITATRTIESRSSRLITILINPFMSCSARLPIYVLLVGTFFPNCAASVFMGLYIAGIVVAVVTARLLRRFWFKKDETPFVMELPPFRMPTLRSSLQHMWNKGEQYLRKMAGLILVASVIVWALNYFPRHETSRTPENTNRDSYLEMAGKAITPVMEPIGFNWRSSVAALAGVPAKEIVVSTLGVLYSDNEAIDDASLAHAITTPDTISGKPGFTPASALAFMVFILLYCPCTASLVAIFRETGNWRYSLFSAIYNTTVAWLAAFVVYHTALLLMH